MSVYTIPENKVRAELMAVKGPVCEFSTPDPAIERIVLVADGQGLSGEYDRVHVLFKSGAHLIYPAHTVQLMRVIEPDQVMVQVPSDIDLKSVTTKIETAVDDDALVAKYCGLFMLAAEQPIEFITQDDGQIAVYVRDELRAQLDAEFFDSASSREILNKAGVTIHDHEKDSHEEA